MLHILQAEFFKFKGMFKRYYVDSIAEILSYLILFVGLAFTVLNKSLSTEDTIFQLIIGIFIWYVGINSIAVFTYILQEEMQLGTLEQIFLTRTSLTKMLIGRAIATFIFDSIGGIVLTLSTVFILNVFGNFDSITWSYIINLSWSGMVILIFLTMIGVYGFAFILAGLSIVFKRIGAITVILNYVFLFFTGITLSESNLPGILDFISKCLPISWGIESIKLFIYNDLSIWGLFSSTTFFYLCINSLIYIVLGIYFFKIMVNISKKDGSLGHY